MTQYLLLRAAAARRLVAASPPIAPAGRIRPAVRRRAIDPPPPACATTASRRLFPRLGHRRAPSSPAAAAFDADRTSSRRNPAAGPSAAGLPIGRSIDRRGRGSPRRDGVRAAAAGGTNAVRRMSGGAVGSASGDGTSDDILPTDGAASILEDIALIDDIPLCDVRNFCFIAHIDHGKSSLASRVLELTGNQGRESQAAALKGTDAPEDLSGDEGGVKTAPPRPSADNGRDSTPAPAAKGDGTREKIELLDTLSVEKERGITVKASAASMLYRHPAAVGPAGVILLNMVDTPGHADFGSEVTRSMTSVQGGRPSLRCGAGSSGPDAFGSREGEGHGR